MNFNDAIPQQNAAQWAARAAEMLSCRMGIAIYTLVVGYDYTTECSN